MASWWFQAPAPGCHAEANESSLALFTSAGRREWPAFRDWFARSLTPALNAWMGSVEVVNEGEKPLDPARRYVFGYAPHGLFPIGAALLCLTCWPFIISQVGLRCTSSILAGFPS